MGGIDIHQPLALDIGPHQPSAMKIDVGKDFDSNH